MILTAERLHVTFAKRLLATRGNCSLLLIIRQLRECTDGSVVEWRLKPRWQQNTAAPIKKAEFVDKHSSPQYNRFSCFLSQVPQTFNLSATTKLRGFIHDYNASFQSSSILHFKHPFNSPPWRHLLVMILWLNSQQNRLLQCKQSHDANASKRVRPFIGASDLRPYTVMVYITIQPYASQGHLLIFSK